MLNTVIVFFRVRSIINSGDIWETAEFVSGLVGRVREPEASCCVQEIPHNRSLGGVQSWMSVRLRGEGGK